MYDINFIFISFGCLLRGRALVLQQNVTYLLDTIYFGGKIAIIVFHDARKLFAKYTQFNTVKLWLYYSYLG